MPQTGFPAGARSPVTAKHLGAYVIGTARRSQHAFVHALGADEVIDYTEEDFAETVRDVDLVIASIGGDYGARSPQTLRNGGTLAQLNPEPDEDLPIARPGIAVSGRASSSSSRATPRWRRSPSWSRRAGLTSSSAAHPPRLRGENGGSCTLRKVLAVACAEPVQESR
ncbi:zinc-binding dehydrogenase [Nonomuraea rubra]|uniref:zinc-binding dehydrogenase n=1 Tax=Nonomuraea rubra TaxID=46180 RepID=UPI0033296FE5